MAEKVSRAGGASRDDGVLRLIGRYKDLISEKAEEAARRSDALKANVAIFWPGFENVRTTQTERQRNEAPSFNIVRLFQIGGLEKYHSRILADLLDPRGCHGQRTLFLERFLEILGLGLLRAELNTPYAHVDVKPEFYVTGESRPDIILRCFPWFLLVIENKIGSGEGRAPDGRWQLEKYRDWLDKQTGVNEKRLIFLTVDGGPSSSGAEHVRVSYLTDIRNLLGDCLERVKAPRVLQTLRQYLETIEDLR